MVIGVAWLWALIGGAAAGYLISKTTAPKETVIAAYNKTTDLAYVTSTTDTLIHQLYPDPGYDTIYLESIWFSITNPAGSGATVFVTFNALTEDLRESYIYSTSVPEGQTLEDTIFLLSDQLPSGKRVLNLRVYARVSATPVTGREPSVRVKAVGLQFGKR